MRKWRVPAAARETVIRIVGDICYVCARASR